MLIENVIHCAISLNVEEMDLRIIGLAHIRPFRFHLNYFIGNNLFLVSCCLVCVMAIVFVFNLL